MGVAFTASWYSALAYNRIEIAGGISISFWLALVYIILWNYTFSIFFTGCSFIGDLLIKSTGGIKRDSAF